MWTKPTSLITKIFASGKNDIIPAVINMLINLSGFSEIDAFIFKNGMWREP